MNKKEDHKTSWRDLPRNIWAVSITSFLTDISSEMVINLLPLYLFNVLGVSAGVIGLIEGLAEATASLLKLFSGWFSNRLGGRKWVAVAGYSISALSKPFYYVANTWQMVAAVRWADRVGKGIRTAPRDALVADSVSPQQRGLAFDFPASLIAGLLWQGVGASAPFFFGALLALIAAAALLLWKPTPRKALSE